MYPNNQAYYSGGGGQQPRKKNRRFLIIILIIAIVGSLVYLFVSGNGGNNNGEQNSDSTTSSGSVNKVPLSTLTDFEFVTPDMDGYIKNSNFTVEVGDFTTSDNACNLQFGVVAASELPGSTPEAIARSHLGATEAAGAVGADPKTGDDLELYSTDGKTKYVMPTLDFAYTRDGVSYKASYSVAMLVGNKRAFVRRYCANSDGQASSSAFKSINDKAEEIKVQTEE